MIGGQPSPAVRATTIRHRIKRRQHVGLYASPFECWPRPAVATLDV
jgi:hypothetical protein